MKTILLRKMSLRIVLTILANIILVAVYSISSPFDQPYHIIDYSKITETSPGIFSIPITYSSPCEDVIGLDMALQYSSNIEVLNITGNGNTYWNASSNEALFSSYTMDTWPRSGTSFVLTVKAKDGVLSKSDINPLLQMINGGQVNCIIAESANVMPLAIDFRSIKQLGPEKYSVPVYFNSNLVNMDSVSLSCVTSQSFNSIKTKPYTFDIQNPDITKYNVKIQSKERDSMYDTYSKSVNVILDTAVTYQDSLLLSAKAYTSTVNNGIAFYLIVDGVDDEFSLIHDDVLVTVSGSINGISVPISRLVYQGTCTATDNKEIEKMNKHIMSVSQTAGKDIKLSFDLSDNVSNNKYEVQVYNETGMLVWQNTNITESKEFYLNSINPGIYVFDLRKENTDYHETIKYCVK